MATRNTGRKKEVDVVTENVAQGQAVDVNELGNPGVIEKVSETQFADAVEMEEFMNEILTIIVHQDTSEGSLDVVSPIVNGVCQPIIRGAKSKVRRKYVENLARTRDETFSQVQAKPDDRASLKMVPRSVVTYPFSVIHDPNPKGSAWLQEILRQDQ